MQTITIFRRGGHWVGRHSDPTVLDLFGTSVLPTPYPATEPAEVVWKRLQALQPMDVLVVVGVGQ